jgi:hypothetical protein
MTATTTYSIADNPRIPQVHEAAALAVVEAEAAEAEAQAAVTAARERLAMGEGTRGELVKAQRVLFTRSEAMLTAQAKVRGLIRQRDELAAAVRAEHDAERARRLAELTVERREIEDEIADAIARAINNLRAVDLRAADWDTRATSFGARIRPSAVSTRVWDQCLGDLSGLANLYPRRTR